MATHPKKLGKYEIVEVLGEGAMGVVYKGFDPGIRRTVALKTIRAVHDDPEGAAMLAARFRNEAQAAGRLNHAGIVNVYDYGDDGQVAYIAMEFVEGQTLAHYLAHKVRFTDDDIVGLMSQLLDALHHAHEAGVVHRDIKPANIMLAKNARLKVADFGIARIEASNLTQVHTMLGTPAYMAPEQFIGGPIDRRVDVYAAGVMLYVLLTNRPPFSGTPEALMYKVVHESPLAPSQLDSVRRPAYYDELLAVALAKDPAERYATAIDFKTAIEQAVGSPVDTSIWEQTIVGVPAARPVRAAVDVSLGGGHSGAAGRSSAGMTSPWTQPPPTNWDRSALTQAEATLARFVGPLAGVMVRRAARECADLPSLYARLAQEVTDPGAKAAFAVHLREVAAQSASTATTATTAAPAADPDATRRGAAPVALSDTFIEQAKKLMTTEVGPIAGVLVKKTAATSPSREAFIEALVAAVPDAAARAQLRERLHKL
jgi:serine/threonine-protein kinase